MTPQAMPTDANSAGAFTTLLEALPDIVYVLDPAGCFLYLNSEVRSIGYDPAALVGKHFSEIIHPEDRGEVSREDVVAKIRKGASLPDHAPKLFDERRSGERMTRELEVRIVRGNGEGLIYASVNAYGASSADPIARELFGVGGPVTIGIIHDITARKRYADSLEESLAAKQLLMREMHHRVQSNLQVVASLANLRSMDSDDPTLRESLQGLVAEVQSIALVHEILSSTEGSGGVDAEEYFGRLARRLRETFAPIGASIGFSWKVDSSKLDADTLTVFAMIAGELVAKAYRSVPAGKGSGDIELSFSSIGGRSVLELRENIQSQYQGLEKSQVGGSSSSISSPASGNDIIEALVNQLGGTRECLKDGVWTLVRVSADISVQG